MSLTRLAVSIPQKGFGATDAASPPTSAPKPQPAADFVDALTKFIPGDILTIYVSFVAFLHSSGTFSPTFRGTWYPTAGSDFGLFWGLLVLSPLWVIGLRWIATPKGQAFTLPAWAAVAGTIAFYVYAMSFENIFVATGPVAVYGGIAFFASPILGLLNKVVGRSWPDQAVP